MFGVTAGTGTEAPLPFEELGSSAADVLVNRTPGAEMVRVRDAE